MLHANLAFRSCTRQQLPVTLLQSTGRSEDVCTVQQVAMVNVHVWVRWMRTLFVQLCSLDFYTASSGAKRRSLLYPFVFFSMALPASLGTPCT